MARSSYIYIIQDAWSAVDSAFTVKHEMDTYIENGYAPERHSILRLRDGGKGGNVVLTECDAAPPPAQ